MLTFALVAFVVAIAVNCVAVHLQKRHRLYDRWFGAHAWTAHIALLVVVWGVVVVSLVVLAFGVALAPAHLPGLTLPDSSQAKAAMRTMPGMHHMSGPGRAMTPKMGK